MNFGLYAVGNFCLRASVCLFQVQTIRDALKPAENPLLPGDLHVSSLVCAPSKTEVFDFIMSKSV